MPPEGLIASPVFTDQDLPLRAPSGRKPYLVAADSPISTSRFQTNRSRSGTIDSSNHKVLLSVILGRSSPCALNGKPVELIQLWNPEEFEQLIENIVGHFLQQQRFKQSFTFFFAVAETSSEITYTIDNVSGQVLEEVPGPGGRRTIVASDLAEFLARLQPEGQGELHA